jgi:hypothetical protein
MCVQTSACLDLQGLSKSCRDDRGSQRHSTRFYRFSISQEIELGRWRPMSERRLNVSFPLDDDGFLPRRCSTCERDFRCVEKDEPVETPPGGYFCPYCGIQAHDWLTEAQNAIVQDTIHREASKVMNDALSGVLADLTGLFETTSQNPRSDPPERLRPHPVVDDDDMRLVDFACHLQVAVKVVHSWDRSVYCSLCGTESKG